MHILASLLFISVTTQQVSGWGIFEDTRFNWEFVDEIGLEVEIPTFSKKVKELEGTEVTLTGHYLPLELEGNRIILSKMPYASCFFCGGGVGQESVAEVYFNSVQRPFRMDELITIKGKLKLNKDDYEHLVFIIEDAKVIQS